MQIVGVPLSVDYQQCPSGRAQDFFLLQRTHALDTGVPVVITAATGEKAAARRVLDQGAFDVISIPLEYEQTVSTIRRALWHHKLNVLIASRKKALERQRQHIAHYPHNGGDEAFWTIRIIRTSIEQSFAAHNRTIYLIETTLQRFAGLARNVQYEARQLAVKRLDRLDSPLR